MSTSHPDDLLPLRPVVFSILMVLRGSPLHGYGVMQRANDHVGQRALLGPGTLYRTLKELRDDLLIETAEPPADTDARRQYYRLTSFGEAVVDAESRRLANLLSTGIVATAPETR